MALEQVASLTLLEQVPMPVNLAKALRSLGANLVRVRHLNRADEQWTFYDPRDDFHEFNTLTDLVTGEFYWIKVRADQTVILNGVEHQLSAGWKRVLW